ncbi:hypothetical protein [Tsukamurella spumae]|uniref:Secreted protein n=1 Tax=Tsukamurella spumae TaxID=44753 RepID=A0A846X2M3_9ACTN|nr:hypothetical protein [Tsukamurella spumae]NKY19341.1 hypothetical protein [Tsukamurella spumae]
MSIHQWTVRTLSAGVLAAAIAAPMPALATPTPAPTPPPAPTAPSNSAVQATCDQWANNRAPRLRASRATVDFTKNPDWTWTGIGPGLDAEQNAIRVELGTLPGTVARAGTNQRLANALRAYQGRLTEYNAALSVDRGARASGEATWAKSNPAYKRVTDATNAVITLCRTL